MVVAPFERRADVISDRDRRVLADIERQTRVLDPELCDRLRGPAPGTGAGSRLLRRTTSTPAIVCWVLALGGALLLGMSLTSLLLVVVIIVVATIRLWRTSGDVGSIPWAPPPYGPPPYGPPPFGPR